MRSPTPPVHRQPAGWQRQYLRLTYLRRTPKRSPPVRRCPVAPRLAAKIARVTPRAPSPLLLHNGRCRDGGLLSGARWPKLGSRRCSKSSSWEIAGKSKCRWHGVVQGPRAGAPRPCGPLHCVDRPVRAVGGMWGALTRPSAFIVVRRVGKTSLMTQYTQKRFSTAYKVTARRTL